MLGNRLEGGGGCENTKIRSGGISREKIFITYRIFAQSKRSALGKGTLLNTRDGKGGRGKKKERRRREILTNMVDNRKWTV